MRRFGIVTAAALLTTAWAGAGPAAADDLHHVDASGDVIAVDKNDWTHGGPGIAPAASDTRDPDFLAVDLRHTTTNVVIVLHL